MKKIIFYAPNINSGGGLTLLTSLLNTWECTSFEIQAFLDRRATEILKVPTNWDVIWINPTIFSRFGAELNLRSNSNDGALLFCFNSLPPLFSRPSPVVVFHQNALYFRSTPFSIFGAKTGFRLMIEKIIFNFFSKNINEFWVQTPTMFNQILEWKNKFPKKRVQSVRCFPFFETSEIFLNEVRDLDQKYDFIYVADGEAHKNHLTLFKAWRILAMEGIRPTLAITLNGRFKYLIEELNKINIESGSEIINLGQLSRHEVFMTYGISGALIYPSLAESFGLPLIEANALGLDVIAAELDYVRDVSEPIQTFDPTSAVSIARAIKRYMGLGCDKPTIKNPKDIWEALINISQKSDNY